MTLMSGWRSENSPLLLPISKFFANRQGARHVYSPEFISTSERHHRFVCRAKFKSISEFESEKEMTKTPSKKKTYFGKPGAFAMARNQAGGDIVAAALLYRIKYYFDPEKKTKRLDRFGKQWIAMSRSEWATEAGLSEGEMKNRALPRLRKFDYVDIRPMRLNYQSPIRLWIHLDLQKLFAATTPDDMFLPILNKSGAPGYVVEASSYAYNKKKEFDEDAESILA
jgi:hypothetical protein